MNASQRRLPAQSTRPAHGGCLVGVRGQAAFVRALLDEVERVVPSGSDDAVNEQLVEELARLGCRFLEAAQALTLAADDAARPLSPPKRNFDEGNAVRRCA